MTIIQGSERDHGEQPYSEGPFAETAWQEREEQAPADSSPEALGYLPWTEAMSPFGAEAFAGAADLTESQLDEAFEAIRDEAFDEAVAELVGETEDVVGQRFSDESGAPIMEKERLADAHLAPIQLLAESYLDSLTEGIAGLDVESLDERQLDELLDRFDPESSVASPAGEEFIGALVKKAKGVAKFVVKAAKTVGKAAGGVLTAALKGLRKLIQPLLKRVLSFAIGRLPPTLQAPARLLSQKIFGESEDEAQYDVLGTNENYAATPSSATDPELLAESFDAAVAEVMTAGEAAGLERETFASEYEDEYQAVEGSAELETLAEARGQLMDSLAQASDGEDLAPVVEQFVPALLGALRVGINLVGRPRVVKFLAGYLGKLIGRWVGPQLSGPLSSAIVDTGLRLVSLEQAEPESENEAVPAMLASTIEDTIRTLAECEDYVLEDEDLMHLATAQAFERAVASNFPGTLVRPGVRRAPGMTGRFVTRRPRSARPYRRYSRAPEIELTEPAASNIKTFGGVTLAAALRAAGATFPLKARVHIYQATVGTSLRRIAAVERARRGGARISSSQMHPLTPEAAAVLLKEPGLGVAVGAQFLRSRRRVAAGQRFFYIEPTTAGVSAPVVSDSGRQTQASQGWLVVDTKASRIIVALYFSETDAQRIAGGVRDGKATAVLLAAMTAAYSGLVASFSTGPGRLRIVKELEEGEELAGPLLARLMPVIRKALVQSIRSWLLPLMSEWVRSRAAEFSRAATDPANGVTVTVTFSGVPGMSVLRQALTGTLGLDTLRTVTAGTVFSGSPTGTVLVRPGMHRP
jgi:hypothetical protein